MDLGDMGGEELRKLIEAAQQKVYAICRGDEKWTMSVPVRPKEDSDVVICDGLRAGLELARRLKEWERGRALELARIDIDGLAEEIGQAVFDESPRVHGNLKCWPGTNTIANAVKDKFRDALKSLAALPSGEQTKGERDEELCPVCDWPVYNKFYGCQACGCGKSAAPPAENETVDFATDPNWTELITAAEQAVVMLSAAANKLAGEDKHIAHKQADRLNAALEKYREGN